MATKKKVWKNGDRFRVKTSSNGYCTGHVYVVNGTNGESVCGADVNGTNVGQWIHKSYVTHYKCDKDNLLVEKAELEAKLEEVKAKLSFLKKNDLEVYDENEFKIYQALTVLDETTDKMERTKKLAELIKGLA